MPGPARRPGGGAESYARAVARTACAQVIYAQAERDAASKAAAAGLGSGGAGGASATPRGGGGGRKVVNTAVPPSAVFASDAVADALADIALAFVTHVGERSASRAGLSGRTHAALPDVLAVLKALAPVTQSHTRDLARYALLEEIPFPVPVPVFPAPVPQDGDAARGALKRSSFDVVVVDPVDADSVDEDGNGKSTLPPWIEPWMPPLPPSRTYKSTPGVLLNGPGTKGKPDRALLSTQRRQVEQSLARLKGKHLDGSDGAGAAFGGVVPATHALAENPFLAPPKVGSARIIDEDIVGGAREPTEPVEVQEGEVDGEGDVAMRDSNAASAGGAGEPTDPKRARVMRILNGSSGAEAQG